jgi:hypothetical protein
MVVTGSRIEILMGKRWIDRWIDNYLNGDMRLCLQFCGILSPRYGKLHGASEASKLGFVAWCTRLTAVETPEGSKDG